MEIKQKLHPFKPKRHGNHLVKKNNLVVLLIIHFYLYLIYQVTFSDILNLKRKGKMKLSGDDESSMLPELV